MNILYTANDKFVPQIGAGICSICENNKEVKELSFYILSSGITKENRKKLSNFTNRYQRQLQIIEIGDIRKYINFDFDTLGWHPVILARLLMDKMLPENIERIIYLDGDTIVRSSLKDLWETNLKDSVIGACMEPTVNHQRLEKLGMTGLPYINSGVLLVDLKKWREEKIGDKIIAYYKKQRGRLLAGDQDSINGTLKDDIHILPLKYNYCNTYDFYTYKSLRKIVAPTPYFSKEEYLENINNPTIIHYLGEERPWREGNRHEYREDFWKYLRKTPWKDMPYEKGWKLYFFCFYTFNFFIKPFPFLRWKIIDYLIPQVMKLRAKNERKK